ncbi:MAG: hypothetical protein JRN08_03135 [Nitrososphaerota archaeon]|nr:hypothetical protein [Nitrososphaerota archaeon]
MHPEENPVVLVPVASPLHDPAATAKVMSAYRSWLEGAFDVEAPCLTSSDEAGKVGALSPAGVLALVVTGGTEHILCAVAGLKRPLLVLAHESMNSLPAALEGISSFSGPTVALVLGRSRKRLGEVREFAGAAKALARIRGHRIGLVGGPSPWLTYSLPDAKALAGRLGIELVDVPMREFLGVHSSTRASVTLPKSPAAVGTVSAADFGKSERVYLALKSIAKKRELTAVTPRCFDFIRDIGATGCVALSKLNDEGVVAGCEGDVPSTVGMITLSEVSGTPAFMANPSMIDGHRVVLAHCTVARKLTRRVAYRTHFESGIGVALAGEMRKGARVTVGRYARDYGVLRAGAGNIVRGEPWSEELCRTQVEVKMDGDAELFRERPMGNHLVLTYGDHVGPLRRLASIAGIEFQEV